MPSAPAYKTFLRRYYLAGFFEEFVFAYAIYTIYFNLHGLSVFRISVLLGWWALAALLFEIPTGALADRWSRKKMLAIAPLFKAGCFFTWFLARGNFYLYGLGFTLWALSESFVSGTTQALLYDQLRHAGRMDDYEEVLGRKSFYTHLALAISLVSGGFIAAGNMELAVLLSVIPLLFSAVFAGLIRDVPKVKEAEKIRYLEYIRIAFREIGAHPVLRYLFAYFGVMFIVFGTLEEFDQLYYHLVRLPLFAFGIAGFIWSSLNALGARYAYKLKDKTWIYCVFPLLSAIGIMIVAGFPGIPVIGLLWFSYFLAAPLQVLVDGRIQRSITSVSRATITSICAFFVNLSAVLLAPALGLIGKVWNLQAIYGAVGILLLLFAFWVFLSKNRVDACFRE